MCAGRSTQEDSFFLWDYRIIADMEILVLWEAGLWIGRKAEKKKARRRNPAGGETGAPRYLAEDFNAVFEQRYFD